jgi:hypothetical protein
MTFLSVLNQAISVIKRDPIILAPGLIFAFGLTILSKQFLPNLSTLLTHTQNILPIFTASLAFELFFLTFTLLIGTHRLTNPTLEFKHLKKIILPVFLRLFLLSTLTFLPFVWTFQALIYPRLSVQSSDPFSLISLTWMGGILVFVILLAIACVLVEVGQVLIAGKKLPLLTSIKSSIWIIKKNPKDILLLITYSIFIKWTLTMLAIYLSFIPIIGTSILTATIQGIEHTLTALVLLGVLNIDHDLATKY